MYVVIQNKGEIDPRAFTLLGASTKRDDDTKIGFFGSGNKYSLAWLIREEVIFLVFSGNRPVPIGTIEEVFGDKCFKVITVDGQRTSITTDTGPKWKKWFVFREFVCNSVDEGDLELLLLDKIEGISGKTRIFLDYDVFGKIYENRHAFMKFWSNPLAITHTSNGDDNNPIKVILYKRTTEKKITNIFRKGILVKEFDAAGLYDYDLEDISINEQRELSNDWTARRMVGTAIMNCSDKAIITTYIANGCLTDLFESTCDCFIGTEVSKEWIEVLTEMGGMVVPALYAGRYAKKYTRIIPIWDWLYSQIREFIEMVAADEEILEEFEWNIAVDKRICLNLLRRLGFIYTDIKITSMNTSHWTLVKGDVLHLNASSRNEFTSCIDIVKKSLALMDRNSLIEHLIASDVLKP